ncbi:unnamed protein product [Meganyctiphanes norvegica]|uniref:Uncharacterized protein n=1 Tax=Meganyctiphanes norvegica TaxID=48144 RepID=A0AAV2SQV7_MEGNR
MARRLLGDRGWVGWPGGWRLGGLLLLLLRLLLGNPWWLLLLLLLLMLLCWVLLGVAVVAWRARLGRRTRGPTPGVGGRTPAFAGSGSGSRSRSRAAAPTSLVPGPLCVPGPRPVTCLQKTNSHHQHTAISSCSARGTPQRQMLYI